MFLLLLLFRLSRFCLSFSSVCPFLLLEVSFYGLAAAVAAPFGTCAPSVSGSVLAVVIDALPLDAHVRCKKRLPLDSQFLLPRLIIYGIFVSKERGGAAE